MNKPHTPKFVHGERVIVATKFEGVVKGVSLDGFMVDVEAEWPSRDGNGTVLETRQVPAFRVSKVTESKGA